MLFNSLQFIFIFLPAVLIGVLIVGRHIYPNAGAAFLAISSIVFYSVWNYHFLWLLCASICFNFLGAKKLSSALSQSDRRARILLIALLLANITLLAYFKYLNFFASTLASALNVPYKRRDITLPIGISFFTFTQIAYLVDIYKRKASTAGVSQYALFVTYFPHLIAGPILHHQQMIPQFSRPSTFTLNSKNLAAGFSIFVLALAKKLFLADRFAVFASPVFEAAESGAHLTLVEAWVGALSYTLQLYFDFSAYSEMALGLSLMLNIRLPLNFQSPYKSANIIEFWRRWHMTLSAFLRDYVYIPLGGNRKGSFRRYVNLMATMLVGGLWHGAGWTFVFWGGLHGAYLGLNHTWRNLSIRLNIETRSRAYTIFSRALTFVAVVFAWVFFRAQSFKGAMAMIRGMSWQNGVSLGLSQEAAFHGLATRAPQLGIKFAGLMPETNADLGSALTLLAAGLAIVWLCPSIPDLFARFDPSWDQLHEREAGMRGAPPARFEWRLLPASAFVVGALFFFCVANLLVGRSTEFLYFQF